MRTLTDDDLNRHPQTLLDHALRGEPVIVTVANEPVMVMVPLGKGIQCGAVLREVAARLYEREQISLGIAAQIAGLSYSEMIDELGRRGIATIRYDLEDLDRESAYVRRLADGR